MFVIGLDLGQKTDYTAVTVVEKEVQPNDKPMLYLRHLERYALGTPYGEQMDSVVALIERIKEKIKDRARQRQPEIIVDATGVGVGVVEMLKDRGLRYRPVSITAGIAETRGTGGTYHVPKRNLVSRAVAPFEGRRLKIARSMTLVPELVKELENFKIKINLQTAHDSYEHWRESDHDDLVLALALACWWVEKPRGLRVTARPAGL